MDTKATAPEIRTTDRLQLRLAPEDVERVQKAAAKNGLTASRYLSALIRGEPIVPRPAAQLQDLALIGNRIASAIAALDELPLDVVKAKRSLDDGKARIAELLRAELPGYDAAVKAQVVEDTWGAPG